MFAVDVVLLSLPLLLLLFFFFFAKENLTIDKMYRSSLLAILGALDFSKYARQCSRFSYHKQENLCQFLA